MREAVLPLLALFLILLTPLAGAEAQGRLHVATTSPRLLPIIQIIGGERVKAMSVVPPGADPHHYEPSQSQLLEALTDADLVVMTGPSHLVVEGRVKTLAETGLIGAEIIDYEDYEAEGLELLTNPKTGSPNPHGYHLSIKGLRAVASACAHAFSRLDPEGADYYKQRLKLFLEQLDSAEKSIKSLNLKGLKVILLSPVLQYVSQDLGLEVVDMVLPELDIEPTEKDIARVVDSLRKGEADFVLMSDLEANRHAKFVSTLREQGVSYVVVPLLKLTDTPQSVSLTTAAIIDSYRLSQHHGAESGVSLVTYSSIAANIVLLLIVLLLMWRVKRGA